MPSLFPFYEQSIQDDIRDEIQEYVEAIAHLQETIASLRAHPISEEGDHKDRFFEFTTHPSQTGDTLIKQKVREAKHKAFHLVNQGVSLDPATYAAEQAALIFEECKKRIYSLENAKIPAHAQMTPDLLQQVPAFFTVYDRYLNLPEWKAEEKAEEKNISFAAFLNEQPHAPVSLDERLEAVMTAKKMLLSGQSKMYQWIDFDGAKRPDGIMLSIFAELLIDDINQGARGISEVRFVAEDSVFTLAEREHNRSTATQFHLVDRSIYALTRYLASSSSSENPVCIAQMEQLKRQRERLLRKLVSIRDQGKRRMQEKGLLDIIYLSERVHFIPRFDPKFIEAVQKSELGNRLEALTDVQMQHYKTASHIIDQILTINSLAPKTVYQIILAQCTCAEEIITLEKFLHEKAKRWREKKGQYRAENPLEHLTLCPLLETKASTTPANVQTILDTLYSFFGHDDFIKRIPELFFAGSDLSKSMGSASSFVRTWEAALLIQEWNILHHTDVRVKLGSGESTFRQSGFLDPKYRLSVFDTNLSHAQKEMLRSLFGVHFESLFPRKSNGMISLFSKHVWLNSVTLQSKAREWIMSMSSRRLMEQLEELGDLKEKNKILQSTLSPNAYAPSVHVQTFVSAENALYESLIGKESVSSKDLISLPALIELFATEMTPVLRDRSLKREGGNNEDTSSLLTKIQNHAQINARAISANTASSVLFPLALLGKAEGFEAVEKPYQESVLLSFENFDLLQVIRQFSPISDLIFACLRENGFETVAKHLETSWEKTLHMTSLLLPAHLKNAYPLLSSLEPPQQASVISCFEPSLRALYSFDAEKQDWSYTSPALEAMRENWKTHAYPLVAKACLFLSGKSKEYPFLKEEKKAWDLFLTIHCRLRGDKGLLG